MSENDLPSEGRPVRWFYKVNGENVGPLEEPEFLELLTSGKISRSTKVWSRELGPVWRRVYEVDRLIDMLHEADEEAKAEKEANRPPRHVAPSLAWIMVFAPVISALGALMLGGIIPAAAEDFRVYLLPAYFLMAYPVVCACFHRIDSKALKASYEESVKVGIVLFLLIPPAYFLLRKNIAKNQHFILPLLSFAVYPTPFLIYWAAF
ncbi:GYF domain-containing protein [Pseudovibrio sp. SPO723]|uniref:GYF domain-containing protein n=1 Tax=Nesiotobacter zosterae TaxID=392721 RepID=UPI0029C3DA33|nr:GYF domain-containing protein [Pseudovibrio sp. SPO723]MDX5592200.1 GYF domain-containing protein [Pseudovibrio sp. SPO723]